VKQRPPRNNDRKTPKAKCGPVRTRPDTQMRSVPPGLAGRWAILGVCLFLAAITWAVFGQTVRYEFVSFDDDVYVYENPAVRSGLTLKGILWAFTHVHGENWHPLTSLSHMLDCELYGLNAGGHHLTNVLLHAAAAIFLFLVVRRMTAALWPSAFVAAVFAIHPLRVESVAWVAERKDVLSGLFFVLTLWAYVRYSRRPPSLIRYGMVVFLFALGLLCKPMLVTLPFVLLLLDYWPLRRFGQATASRWLIPRNLIVEKIPLFVLSAAACAVTFLVQHRAIRPIEAVSFFLRISNALVSCAVYLTQMVYPKNLAVFYPFPAHGLPPGKTALAFLLLVSVTMAAFFRRKNRPYFLVGWLWYLGMLVPVIGLVQAGMQAHADRYTYLPQIGLYLLLTWMAVELTASWRCRAWVLGVGAAGILAALILCARAQTSYWHDSESLWAHAVACTSDNALAETNLGSVLFNEGRLDETIAHCQRAVEMQPDYSPAWTGLGSAFLHKGQLAKAISYFRQAVKLHPAYPSAQNDLALALLQAGNVDEAITHFRNALETDPDLAETHTDLGYALLQKGQVEAAIDHYQKALELNPEFVPAFNNLAWVLATCPRAPIRNGARAVELAQRAKRLSGGANLTILRTLAAAYAEAGRFPEALEAAGQALDLATRQGNAATIDALQREIRLYRDGSPLRDWSQAP